MMLLVVLIAAIVLFLLWKSFFTKRKAEAWLPQELVSARLVAVEKKIETSGKFPLTGRIDRLYQLQDGQLVVVERKNRKNGNVYPTDRLQLSLYAYMLRQTGELQVAPFGYVAFPEILPAQRVDLYTTATVEQKLSRYGQLKNGEISPRRATGGKCRECPHATNCQ